MSRVVLCGASKPLKLVACSDLANVSIGWISSLISGSSFEVVEACPSISSLNGKGIEQNLRLHEHLAIFFRGKLDGY